LAAAAGASAFLEAGFRASRLARDFGGFIQTIDVSEAAAALLDFIVLFSHTVSPPL